MTPRYGATLEEWAHWSLVMEATEDLLPCVVAPGLPISPNSDLTTYGKTPSTVIGTGVIGFPRWTQYHATDVQIGQWEADPRLGICLQTRRYRALDVDVTEEDLAWRILREFLCRYPRLPYRTRADSSKFLVLVQMEGPLAKQTLQTPHGIIEFLADGQQCLVAGTHKDGQRYQWSGDWTKVPVLDALDLEVLQESLRAQFANDGARWSEGRVRRARVAGGAPVSDDPVVHYLRSKGLVLDEDWLSGRIDIQCPWADQHTTDTGPSATSYFVAGSGGFEQGHMRCLHGHCSERTDRDFLDAIGYTEASAMEGFEDCSQGHDVVGALTGGVGDGTGTASPIETPRYDRHPTTGKVRSHLNNVLLWLEHQCTLGSTIAFDIFKDELTIQTPEGRRKFADQDYTQLQALAESRGTDFDPIGRQLLRDAVHLVALRHTFDSAQTWIASLPEWDGVPRIDTFCETYLRSAPDAHSRAVGRYLWTAMAGRILSPGCQADMTLILKSSQGTRKSSFLRAMAPQEHCFTDSISFMLPEAEIARLTKGKTLVEIPEIHGLRTRDLEAIKAMATKRENQWTPKYMEMSTTYPRRFLFVGTTNEDEYLSDVTGERRWLPLSVGRQDDEAMTRDHTQLWAEGVVLYRAHGILWSEAQETGRLYHPEVTTHDPTVDLLRDWLDQLQCGFSGESVPLKNSARPFLRLVDVWKELCPNAHGIPSHMDQLRIGNALRRCGYKRETKRVGSHVQKVWVPDVTALIGSVTHMGNSVSG